MKLGFSTLSLFLKPLDEILDTAKRDGFEAIEILSEGPYAAYNIEKNDEIIKISDKGNIEINIHGPTVDLNLASINEGIRRYTGVSKKFDSERWRKCRRNLHGSRFCILCYFA